MQALKLKDSTIKKLEQQLQRMATELARAEERERQAEAEKSQLKVKLVPIASVVPVRQYVSAVHVHPLERFEYWIFGGTASV